MILRLWTWVGFSGSHDSLISRATWALIILGHVLHLIRNVSWDDVNYTQTFTVQCISEFRYIISNIITVFSYSIQISSLYSNAYFQSCSSSSFLVLLWIRLLLKASTSAFAKLMHRDHMHRDGISLANVAFGNGFICRTLSQNLVVDVSWADNLI